MRQKVALVVLLAIVIVGVALCLRQFGGMEPPVPAVAKAPVASTAAASESVAALVDPTPPADRIASPGAGLVGLLLDDAGAPLPDTVVFLRALQSKIAGSEMQCTDAEGRFRFAKAVGAVRLTVEGELLTPCEFELPAGEVTQRTFRCDLPCLVLHGRVRRGAEGVSGRMVFAYDAEVTNRAAVATTSNAEGEYRLVLQPGRYRLEVRGQALPSLDGLSITMLAPLPMGVVTIALPTRRLLRDLELPGSSVRVLVAGPDGRPESGINVSLATQERNDARVGRTDHRGEVAFHELGAGVWQASLTSSRWVNASHSIDLAGAGFREVRLVAMVAGTVIVRRKVLDGGDRVAGLFYRADAFQLQQEWDPLQSPIVAEATWGLDFDLLKHDLVIPRLMPGRYELRCVDRVVDGQHIYAPVQPFTRNGIDVRSGETTVVEFESSPRRSVSVAVMDSERQPWPLPTKLHGPAGEVFLDTALGGCSALVPDGEYSVAVTAPTGLIEERFVVDAGWSTHTVVVPGKAPPKLEFQVR